MSATTIALTNNDVDTFEEFLKVHIHERVRADILQEFCEQYPDHSIGFSDFILPREHTDEMVSKLCRQARDEMPYVERVANRNGEGFVDLVVPRIVRNSDLHSSDMNEVLERLTRGTAERLALIAFLDKAKHSPIQDVLRDNVTFAPDLITVSFNSNVG